MNKRNFSNIERPGFERVDGLQHFTKMMSFLEIWSITPSGKTKSKNENRKTKNENRKTKIEKRKSKIEKRKSKNEIFFRVAEPVKIQLFPLIIFYYCFIL